MKKILCLFLIFSSLQLSSQSTISGVVSDIDGCVLDSILINVQYKDFVQDSLVLTISKTVEIFTNDTGFYSIELNNQSNVVLVFMSSVFSNKREDVNLTKDTVINVVLEEFDYGYPPSVRKPIIYLYPEHETIVDVKIGFNGTLTNTYPNYGAGWQVLAKPNGDLINQHDNSRYRYLFWDGINDENYQISYFQSGFIVKTDEVLTFLDTSLTKIGLNDFEKNDFITFWLPLMKENDYNFVHFLINDDCDEIATLDISPKPDTEIRVYMVFANLDEPISVTPQKLKSFERKGFVMIEWGGLDISLGNVFN